jgi:hypothetical protein
VGAQELVDLRQLGAGAGRLAARLLGGGLEAAAVAPRALGRRVGPGTALGGITRHAGQPLELGGRGGAARSEILELGFEPRPPLLGELAQLGLEQGDALGGAVVAAIALLFRVQRLQARGAPLAPLLERRGRLASGLQAQDDPLTG